MTNLPQSVRRRLDAKTSSDHPDAGLLTAFAEQALDVSERERVLLHLATCAACREVVALAAPEAPPEEVTPLAPAWFRWPLLRWAAVAATAVIVWAAVAVLVPRTSVRDVSVPAPS
ncbi:MAG: zf-HC2 domain-containing protein [Terriglobales bacterium]